MNPICAKRFISVLYATRLFDTVQKSSSFHAPVSIIQNAANPKFVKSSEYQVNLT